MSFRGVMLLSDKNATTNDEDNKSEGTYWQDEAGQNTSEFEIGFYLANIAYILQSSIQPKTNTRFTGRAYENSFQGSEAVEVLTGLGVAPNRKEAVKKCSMLLAGAFLVPLSHERENSFHDGTHLYRFSEQEELQATLDTSLQSAPHPK